MEQYQLQTEPASRLVVYNQLPQFPVKGQDQMQEVQLIRGLG